MNFMRIKKIGKMATAAIIAFIAVVVFINPQKAQASQGGAVTVTATSNYVLDDSHNVDISITAYVEYAYDEGAYGWVINIIPQSWSKTSDNVTIDNMDYEDDYGYQTSTAIGYEKDIINYDDSYNSISYDSVFWKDEQSDII